ncbi:hypothetical protein ACI3K4_22945 [Streptomyces sp. CSMPJR101]|uniref:hypothetical protein n=1 Tax=Streptomyces sp. CSMPJR101 TaxID=1279378 RepID=UPI003851FDAA
MPGRVADYLRTTELEPAERAALGRGGSCDAARSTPCASRRSRPGTAGSSPAASEPGARPVSRYVAGDTARVSAEVTATRNRMPVHAGNLEVISAAAIYAAEQHALVKAPALKELAR